MSLKDISEIVEDYDTKELTIGTIGSHSALNIFRGAKDEGLDTVCICKEESKKVYQNFGVVDEFIIVDEYTDLIHDKTQDKLRDLNTILIPHGSFNAYIGDKVNEIPLPIFGNRDLLNWETNRNKQREWLKRSGVKIPKVYESPDEIDGPVIAKFPGAKGGQGYFITNSTESFYKKSENMVEKGHITEKDLEDIHIQEYIVGVNAYPQYFVSISGNRELEILGVDRRYESSVDGIGRIPSDEQLGMDINPTYTVVGNFPLTLRESLLSKVLDMGERVVETSREISSPGIFGPFCLEIVITDDLELYVFEISARIVAGTNPGIGTSPYPYIKYGENMYMGRRISAEVLEAAHKEELNKILS